MCLQAASVLLFADVLLILEVIIFSLQDLSHYEYDQMVVKAMSLLNRYYSAHDNLFKRAVQAQVSLHTSV